MTPTRRIFMQTAAAAGAVTLLPYCARAAAHAADRFDTKAGPITVHPVSHASFVMETPAGVIWVDPVGALSAYDGLPRPAMVLVTHQHGDHFNAPLLNEIVTGDVHLVSNPAVAEMLAGNLDPEVLANGESTTWNGIGIDAIPAYNTTETRLNFHPKGRDNGYVLTIAGFRTYISGDTEDVPEMRALENIDLAFVCMNLPFTMDARAAASVVDEFAPIYVYPYHYRGRDNGTQDPAEFAALLGGTSQTKLGSWYS